MRKPFSSIFKDETSMAVKIPKEHYLSSGNFPIVDQGKELIAGYWDNSDGLYRNVPAIVFGDHTRMIKYVDSPFFLGADGVKLLKSKVSQADYKYLYYALSYAKIPDTGYNRHFKWLKQISINFPNKQEQQYIAQILDTVQELIKLRKEQIEKLDLLIKSQFISMFGDPVANPKKWEKINISELYEFVDGDRGNNYPKQNEFYREGYCLFLNTGNITKYGFDFSTCQYITKEKDMLLRKGKLKRDDLILTTRGTVGNIAIYTNGVPFEHIRINSGMVILRLKNGVSNIFFKEMFNFREIYEKSLSGSAQPQLPIFALSKIKVPIPPIKLQNEFADFVIKVEENRKVLKDSLSKLETTYKALMQQFFEE